jgi:hypothetical protein
MTDKPLSERLILPRKCRNATPLQFPADWTNKTAQAAGTVIAIIGVGGVGPLRPVKLERERE